MHFGKDGQSAFNLKGDFYEQNNSNGKTDEGSNNERYKVWI